jgi:hypothetical protein
MSSIKAGNKEDIGIDVQTVIFRASKRLKAYTKLELDLSEV